MLIRTQDKKQLVNLDRVGNIIADKNILRAVFTNEKDDHVKLGQYFTEAKAIKVLDMICSFADGHHYEQVKPEECGYISGAVFQMPSDEEVGE